MLTKRGLLTVADAASQLGRLVSRFLVPRKAVYDTTLLKPKHHWLLDIPAQLTRDQMILDAFVIERRHLLVKGVAEHVRNTSEYEQSVVASVLTLQVREARELSWGDGLLGPTSTLAGFGNARVARRIAIHTFELAVDEVVVRGDEAAVIMSCAEDVGGLFLFVSPMTLERQLTTHASRYRRTAALRVWRAADVQHCLAWQLCPDGAVFVLRQ